MPISHTPAPTTSNGLDELIKLFLRNLQLPSALMVLSQIAKQSKDAAANHIAQMAASSCVAAENDYGNLVSLLQGISSYFNNVVNSATGVEFGFETLTFAGSVANESITNTVTGQTWAVDGTTTPVIAFYTGGALSSDVNAYNFNIKIDSYVAGTGFDITATTPSTLPGGPTDFVFLWIGLTSP